MNNRFKFRVWDKLAERMIYPHNDNQQHFIIDLNGQFHNLQNGSGGDDYVIQQYTGLTDSNDVPIYEGDIVNYKTWEGRHDGIIEENQTQVQFKDGAYYPRYINDVCEDSWYSFKVYDLEVVGNVFETPHLDKNE
jgi:uncharacterized phage protein (TIGR01671 family)